MKEIKFKLDDAAFSDLVDCAKVGVRTVENLTAMIVEDWLYGVSRHTAHLPAPEFKAKPKRAAVTQKVRWAVFSKDGGVCQECRAPIPQDAPWHVDHIIRVADGGRNHLLNYRLLCQGCNLAKG